MSFEYNSSDCEMECYPPHSNSILTSDILNSFFFKGNLTKKPINTSPYFMDGKGGKPSAILTENLTPKDSRLKLMNSP